MERDELIHRTAVLCAALMKGFVLSYTDMNGVHTLKVDTAGDVWVKELESEEFIKSSLVVDIKFLQKIAFELSEIQYLEIRNYLITKNFIWR